MEWIADICSFIGNLAWKTYKLASDVDGAWWDIGGVVSKAFYSISEFLETITGRCVRFAYWIMTLSDSISNFVTRFDVLDLLGEIPRRVGELWSWFLGRFDEVRSIVADWWEVAKDTVFGWISTFVDVVYQLIDNLEARVNRFSDRWDDFWTITYPTLANHIDIADAINKLQLEWSDLFNTWSKLSEDVKLFFTDPLGYLYERLEDFFDRWW